MYEIEQLESLEWMNNLVISCSLNYYSNYFFVAGSKVSSSITQCIYLKINSSDFSQVIPFIINIPKVSACQINFINITNENQLYGLGRISGHNQQFYLRLIKILNTKY